jgi:hypothetical protein
MTDPTGLCFICYRRARAAEAALLVAALRDRGVPTWQDVADLPTVPAEASIRRSLADPATACAVIFATPEVEGSDFIRNVEAPLIIDRCQRDDGFFAVPVAAGGLDHRDLLRVLGPNTVLAHLPGWNSYHLAGDPADPPGIAALADLVLKQRLVAIHGRFPAGEALRVVIATRAPLPKTPGPTLALDLTHRFTGRVATSEAWTGAILPALKSVARAIAAYAPGREVELSGFLAIPAAVAIGAAFLAPADRRVVWRQVQQGLSQPPDIWGLQRDREPSGFEVRTDLHAVSAADLALLVSVADNVTPDFITTQQALPVPPLRAAISISHPGGRRQLTAGQALDVANLAIDALRAARTLYNGKGTIHLFMAAPVGLAMMIGQLLNTFGRVQTYEHIPGTPNVYTPAALLTPSV